jgi:hypothetical protein
MSLIQNLFHSLRNVLAVDTVADTDEAYLSHAIDHADLERRIASQSRDWTTASVLNIGR